MVAASLAGLPLAGSSAGVSSAGASSRADSAAQSLTVRSVVLPEAALKEPAAGSRNTSWFTGLAGRSGPVLAVKIDNVRPARPHTGVDKADIVYVEPVEAGQSRLLAVYSSTLPSKVGPVRSARESDMELLRQFGRPALAYSGSQAALKPIIDRSPLIALSPDEVPGAFTRDSARIAPHNLYVNPGKALAAAPKAEQAKDIGFRFGAAPSAGVPVNRHVVRYPAAEFSFTWSSTRKRWLVGMDGAAYRDPAGVRIGAPTVVIQEVDVHASAFKDRWGSVSPYAETVGQGAATVLRDGKSFKARWSRPTAASGTSFVTPSGDRLNFAPGPVWVVLVDK
jgi:hypothetical protein